MFKALRKRLFRLKGDERGFTIVELLVVITIVGVLAGVGVSGYQRFQERAYATAADAAWRDLQVAISLYEAENGDFPRHVVDANGTQLSLESLVEAVEGQLIPPPEPLTIDRWRPPAEGDKPGTGFIAVENKVENLRYTCVWVSDVASRFNHELCLEDAPE